jgi:restriction endonuclease S subunit
MTFELSKTINPNKVFLTPKSEAPGRWDPFYFVPSAVALENKIRNVTSRKLRDFVLHMAGGATPPTTEADIHYTENSHGIPFIRVQNLSTTGKLNLEDCKRITRSTHEGLLARSRLTGGELLVKITGVGRMAVASVVPDGFEGNINQHIVAIRTKDVKTSETLAAYLNLDMAERLASRRSTGGTRPALDYPALLSIPIIFDKRIPELTAMAVHKYEEKLAKAKAILVSLDKIVLTELGIKIEPNLESTVEGRMYLRPLSQVLGKRLDAPVHWKRLSLATDRFPMRKLRELVAINPSTRLPKVDTKTQVSFVPMDAVSDLFGEIHDQITRPLSECKSYTIFQEGDLIWAKITPCMENGKSAVANNLAGSFGFGSTEFHVFRPMSNQINIEYLYLLFRLKIVRHYARLFFTGTSGHQRVDEQFFRVMEIPLPSLIIQKKITEIASTKKEEAKNLFKQASDHLENTKAEIEALILNK